MKWSNKANNHWIKGGNHLYWCLRKHIMYWVAYCLYQFCFVCSLLLFRLLHSFQIDLVWGTNADLLSKTNSTIVVLLVIVLKHSPPVSWHNTHSKLFMENWESRHKQTIHANKCFRKIDFKLILYLFFVLRKHA